MFRLWVRYTKAVNFDPLVEKLAGQKKDSQIEQPSFKLPGGGPPLLWKGAKADLQFTFDNKEKFEQAKTALLQEGIFSLTWKGAL
jgi:hypothetical protein